MIMDFNFFDIFNYIGYVLGYILWFFFEITKNYGVSIILFTLVITLVLLPFSIKQQKSMAKNARISAKQKEIQKKHANDKKKQNEETAKLYSEEGNPMSGCTSMLVPMALLFGVYQSVLNPLQNTLHIATSKISEAMLFLQSIPGIGATFGSRYGEIEIIKTFPLVKDGLTMFSANEMQNLSEFYNGFSFLGLDLLSTPKGMPFLSFLWVIPVLSLLTNLASTYFMQKIQGTQQPGQQGCMKFSMYLVPLFTAWIAYTVPAAVGLYWIASTVIRFIQSIILDKFYNINVLNAKSEAARIALRRNQENDLKESI